VERTLFLLRYISNTEVRRVIRAETTKIEAYNDFLEARLHVIYFQSLRTTLPARYDISGSASAARWSKAAIREQEKQLKYASLVANAIMLSNVAGLTEVLRHGHGWSSRHSRPGRLHQSLHAGAD
jgi:TnpA family transposase